MANFCNACHVATCRHVLLYVRWKQEWQHGTVAPLATFGDFKSHLFWATIPKLYDNIAENSVCANDVGLTCYLQTCNLVSSEKNNISCFHLKDLKNCLK